MVRRLSKRDAGAQAASACCSSSADLEQMLKISMRFVMDARFLLPRLREATHRQHNKTTTSVIREAKKAQLAEFDGDSCDAVN